MFDIDDTKGTWRLYSRKESAFLWYEIRVPGKAKLRRSTGTSDLKLAQKVALDAFRAQQGISFQDAVVDFFEHTTVKPSSRKRYLTSLRSLDPHFADLSLNQIDKKRIQEFVKARRTEGVMDSTVRRDLACLSTIISHAMEFLPGAPEHNTAIEFKKKRLKEKARFRFLTRGEVDQLRRACSEFMHEAVIEIAVQTGMRQGEILNLEWSWIDFDRQTVTIPAALTKTGLPRIVPLYPTALDTLRALPKALGTQRVFWFRDNATGEIRPMGNLRRWWLGALKRSKIEDLRFHDLRHTFASWYLGEGGDIFRLSKILGHASVSTTNRYSHLMNPETLRSVDSLPGHKVDTAAKCIGHRGR